MQKILVVGVVLLWCVSAGAQKMDSLGVLNQQSMAILQADIDSLTFTEQSSQTLRYLKDGAVIVRLKTSPKSVEAYRKAGRNDIADKIEHGRKKQNIKLIDAFLRNFFFCKVYFIYSSDTKAFLEGNRKVFLNDTLAYDTSITLTGNNFVFCEYGSVDAYSKFQDYSHPVAGNVSGVNLDKMDDKAMEQHSSGTSTSPATTSGLVLLDKELKQLQRPFPYVEGVYLENFDAAVRTLSRDMERAYNRLVVKKDMKEELKAEKKRLKAERKKQPRYNPFK